MPETNTKWDTIGWQKWSTGSYARLKFDHINKQYMCKPESVRENETHKILWDFEIQTDHPIPSRRQDLVLINKKKGFVIPWVLPFQQTSEWKLKKEKRSTNTWTLAENF